MRREGLNSMGITRGECLRSAGCGVRILMRVNACPGAAVPTVTRPVVASLAMPLMLPAALSLVLTLAAPALAGEGLILRFGADGSFGPAQTTRSFAKHYAGGELIAPLRETALVPDTAEGSRADRLRVRPAPNRDRSTALPVQYRDRERLQSACAVTCRGHRSGAVDARHGAQPWCRSP